MTDHNDEETMADSSNFADRRAPSGKGRRAADRGEDTRAATEQGSRAERRAAGRKGRRIVDARSSFAAPETGRGPSLQEDRQQSTTPIEAEAMDAHAVAEELVPVAMDEQEQALAAASHLRAVVRARRAAARALIAANDRLGEPTPDVIRKLAAEQDREDQELAEQAVATGP